jgi:hypothetical protein
MAATKSQGKSFSIFLVGITVLAAGLAVFSSGLGKIVLLAGIIIIAIALVNFFKIKPEEGKLPECSQPVGLRLAGLVAAVCGWLVVLFGLHASSGVSGRLITTLVGIAISLVGVLVLLPAAANKNAFWKA